MCFVLYAGTTKPIPRRKWQSDAPDLHVAALSDRETPIRAHFKSPEVQYIGSTSDCGCDFPHVTQQNGEWPLPWEEVKDPDRVAVEQKNRESLVKQLREIQEPIVELYGVWDGDFDFSAAPRNSESIPLQQILDSNFYFKEQGFYTVFVENTTNV